MPIDGTLSLVAAQYCMFGEAKSESEWFYAIDVIRASQPKGQHTHLF